MFQVALSRVLLPPLPEPLVGDPLGPDEHRATGVHGGLVTGAVAEQLRKTQINLVILCAKELALGYLNSSLAASESLKARFTKPKTHSFAHGICFSVVSNHSVCRHKISKKS